MLTTLLEYSDCTCFDSCGFFYIVPDYPLTHWGRVTHICVSKLTIIGSINGLSPGRRQAIIWTNAGILLIWTLGTHFSEILSKIHIFSFKKIHFKMSSGKRRPFCLGLNELNKQSNCHTRDVSLLPQCSRQHRPSGKMWIFSPKGALDEPWWDLPMPICVSEMAHHWFR